MSERLFLAVALSDDVRHGLAAHLATQLGGRPIPGRPARPEGWHITLRFLGWATEEQRDRVLGFLSTRMDVPPFTLGFGGLGAFPREGRAAVLWLGVRRGDEELSRLAALAEDAASAAGFEPEERPFHAHVTLARIRPPQDVSALVADVADFPLTQEVTAMTMFRSHLVRGGARYEPVERVDLR
ncbi:MAG: RNA 2',3'-cyclic phosphodiesterase [Actinobacteria bacterium]|nr:MAG: RNA 2',3'-cyclic phosphodiesterase [Actinomycetota bacterium]